ncbi:hypothetical protein ACTOB_003956 [Actinoplanes oblitus]|uniref:Luciferase-like domain-containing protein n=1 Tax=Actinoplanes oblitus TaxID=3040509 RepID=A0ABY8WVX1_9ACTN|nr:hypothetical protein [Actinoplanes oblitus]WIN00261.1 hypothetical protein ACTOB_003956 [Actinoplanes oblitus]
MRLAAPSTAHPRPDPAIPMYVLATGTGLPIAAELLLPEAWAMARSRTEGVFPPLEPVATVRAARWTARQRQYLEQTAAAAIAGTPERVERRLAELLERTGAAELVAAGSTFDRDALRASDAALAAMFHQA